MASACKNEFDFVARVLKAEAPQVESKICQVDALGLTGLNTRLVGLLDVCGSELKNQWLGEDSVKQGLSAQWLSFKANDIGEEASDKSVELAMQDLDKYLRTKSFLVSESRIMLADISTFWALRNRMDKSMVSTYPGLVRWFNHIQNAPSVRTAMGKELKTIDFVLPPAFQSSKISDQSGSTAEKSKQDSSDKKAIGGKAVEKKEKKVESPRDGLATSKTKKKSEEAKNTVESKSNADDQPAVTKLDIRVGLITKCWKHPDSEKLFCEQIDVGEDEPRAIASGISPYYNSPSDIEGRKVLVLCNLKARNLGGYKSHGMVLCASSADKSQVELVEPPKDAKIGERVMFDGIQGNFEPISAAQIAKRKVFEGVAPGLKTNDACQAFWEGSDGTIHLFRASGGTCVVPSISNGAVS